jgi:hypothetical protein
MKYYIKKIIKLVAFVLCILVVNRIIEYCVYDDTYTGEMTSIYNDNENIDILILGSSHADVSFNEMAIENGLGKHVFNAGTAVQKPDGSYYILKEALKTNDIETVYMDMFYYMYHDEPETRTNTQLEFVYRISDDMKWSFDKIEYLLNASKPEYYLYSFVKASRSGSHLFDMDYVEKMIKQKRYSDEDVFEDGTTTNEDNSDLQAQITQPDIRYQMGESEPFTENNISDYSQKYIKKMAKLCEENGVRLVLLATPMTDFQLSIFGNYDNYVKNVQELADELNIEYYDYNLCDEKTLGLTDDCFSDLHHLNGKGKDIFSDKFIKFETGVLNYGEEFYASYENKLAAMENVCFGIEILPTENGNEDYIKPICNRTDLNIGYSIAEVKEIGKVQSVSENFTVEDGKRYIIRIYEMDKMEELRYYEITF